MAILSVRPSVRLSRPGTDSRPGEIETPGLHHMIVSSFQRGNLVPLGEEIPLQRWHQRAVPPSPLINRYFTSIGSSSVKTVADRHRLNKHCRRAFQWYQHHLERPRTPKIGFK